MSEISSKKWDWLKQRSSIQCKWVFDHLSRKNLIRRNLGMTDYQAITSLFESWPDDAEHREKLNLAKGAWKTHTIRSSQTNSKGYNFVLLNSVKKHLDALAKHNKLTINKTLESLIEESYNLLISTKTDTPKRKAKVLFAEEALNSAWHPPLLLPSQLPNNLQPAPETSLHGRPYSPQIDYSRRPQNPPTHPNPPSQKFTYEPFAGASSLMPDATFYKSMFDPPEPGPSKIVVSDRYKD